MRYRVTLLKGDGIGPEVTGATCRILAAAGAPIDWEEAPAGAEAMARAALTMARACEAPILLADTLSDLAMVLRQAGRHEEAAGAIAEAVSIYLAKGDLISRRRAAEWADAAAAS